MKDNGKELFDKVVNLNKEYDSKIDTILIAISSPLLLGYFALINITDPLMLVVRIFLLTSFIANLLALLFMIWYGIRYKTRYIDWTELVKQCSDNNYKQFRILMDKLVVPNTLYKFSGDLSKVLEVEKPKNKEEFKKIIMREQDNFLSIINDDSKETNLAIAYLINKSLLTDVMIIDERVFRKPRVEKYSKLKYIIDIASWKTRYLFFTLGISTTVIAVILHILTL